MTHFIIFFLFSIFSFAAFSMNNEFMDQDKNQSDFFLMSGDLIQISGSSDSLIDLHEIRNAKSDFIKIQTAQLGIFGVKVNDSFTILNLRDKKVGSYILRNAVSVKIKRKDGKVIDFYVALTDRNSADDFDTVTGFSIRNKDSIYKSIKSETIDLVAAKCEGIFKDNSNPNCFQFSIGQVQFQLNQRSESSYSYIYVGKKKLKFPGLVKIDSKNKRISFYLLDKDIFFFGHEESGDTGESCFSLLKVSSSLPSSINLGCVGGN